MADYSASPSGVVITVLVGLDIALTGWIGRYFVTRIDSSATAINTLNVSLATLSKSVEALDKTVEKLDNNNSPPNRGRYRG